MRLLADPHLRIRRAGTGELDPGRIQPVVSLAQSGSGAGDVAGTPVDLAGLRFDNRMLLQDGLAATLMAASETRAWRIGLFNTTPMLDAVEALSIQQGRDNIWRATTTTGRSCSIPG